MKQRKGETREEYNERQRQKYARKKALEGKTVRTYGKGEAMTPTEQVQKWRSNPKNKKRENILAQIRRRKKNNKPYNDLLELLRGLENETTQG